MNRSTLKLFAIISLLAPSILQSMSGAMIRSLRDGQFTQATNSAQSSGINQTNLTNACNVINTPGLASDSTYFTDFLIPFAQTFGGLPSTVCSSANLASLPTIIGTLTTAVPSRGGTLTATSEQAALQAVQNYVANGGSPFIFGPDMNALIAGLVMGSGASTGGSTSTATDPNVITIANNINAYYSQAPLITSNTVNMTNLVQFSSDLSTFLASLPSSINASSSPFATWTAALTSALNSGGTTTSSTSVTTDPNVIAIATNLNQYGNGATSFLNTGSTAVIDMPTFAAGILELNNPADNILTPTASQTGQPTGAIGLIDQQIAIYESDQAQSTLSNSQQYALQSSPQRWGSIVAGALGDANSAYQQLLTYDSTNGSNPIAGFTYTPTSYLETLIQSVVTSAQTSTGGSGSSTDFLTNASLVQIGTALSGINYTVAGTTTALAPDNYLATGGTALDPNQLTTMATFATNLRNAVNTWMGSSTDSSTACDPSLSFTLHDFATYVANMNGAVSDETDIIQQLADPVQGIFAQLQGQYVTTVPTFTLVYTLSMPPSYNIYGPTEDGNPNPNGLYANMLLVGGSAAPAAAAAAPLDLGSSVQSLASLFANVVSTHNDEVQAFASACLQMATIFTDPTTNPSSTATLTNGQTISVTGTVGQTSTSTRNIAQQVFFNVSGDASTEGMIVYFNNQANYLSAQAAAIRTASSTATWIPQDTSTYPTAPTGINFFVSTTNATDPTSTPSIAMGTSTAGIMNVALGAIALP